MIHLPDTNACVQLLRSRNATLLSHWKNTKPGEIAMCSIVVYELRHGAWRCSEPLREHAKLDLFLAPMISLPFDDECAGIAAEMRADLERKGMRIGPHDLQIASVAIRHNLTLVTHNVSEFSRVPNLKWVDWQE